MRKALTLLLVAGPFIAGCSIDFSKSLNVGDVERQVESDLAERRDVEVEVSCPEEVEAESGGEFTCTATDPEGNELDVDVVQEDDDGNVDWDVAMLNMPLIEDDLSRRVSRSVRVPVEISCPRILVSSEAGSTVLCDATDDAGGEGVLLVTTEGGGDVTWELNPD